ncbi:unnamed protein product [Ciceribacter selenitireducens ATCC BAA-1503]|uniref:Uncharacterized protein n=1 Tax=Ciceribacter selenitireducens ATCC BAA-1503 TaxID=1336235 RepID=A0A376AEK2_9HYPH|nr:unnamed protein product [Ciceribacter selenitireducens ATCC BAA-1503]
MAAGVTGFTTLAFAKGENGGGNGGGGNGNGGSNGNGNGGGSGKSSSGNTGERGNSSQKAQRSSKVSITEDAAKTPGLRSLNRNYHAYLNSNDPRMTAVSAYAQAYAEFEAANGVDAIPTDPELSDEALREALAGFTKDGIVTDATLDEAKSILGVGTEVGKIDQIRESLASDESDLDAAE